MPVHKDSCTQACSFSCISAIVVGMDAARGVSYLRSWSSRKGPLVCLISGLNMERRPMCLEKGIESDKGTSVAGFLVILVHFAFSRKCSDQSKRGGGCTVFLKMI